MLKHAFSIHSNPVSVILTTMSAARVLFVVYELPPLGGGVATAASQLLKEFSKQKNIIIDVVTSSLNNKWEKEQLSKNIVIHKIPIGKKTPERYQRQTPWEMMRFTVRSLQKIHWLLKQEKYQIAHYFGYPSALPGYIFRRKVPYIVSLRGVDVPGYNQKFGLYYHLYKPLAKLTWRHAQAVIANSRWLADLAQKTLDREIRIIPNGVDTDKFKPVAEKDKFKQFTVTAGGTVMGPKKGLEYLMEGFAIFHKKHPESRLLLFGSGVLENKLRHMASDLGIKSCVEFAGRVSHDELASQLPRCHVMCLPSLAEGMSNAVLEAAASGLPLVLTEVGGTKELLDKNGFMVKKRNANEIAIALTRLYDNKRLRIEMGKISRRMADIFSWKNTSSSYLHLYKSDLLKTKYS